MFMFDVSACVYVCVCVCDTYFCFVYYYPQLHFIFIVAFLALFLLVQFLNSCKILLNCSNSSCLSYILFCFSPCLFSSPTTHTHTFQIRVVCWRSLDVPAMDGHVSDMFVDVRTQRITVLTLYLHSIFLNFICLNFL